MARRGCVVFRLPLGEIYRCLPVIGSLKTSAVVWASHAVWFKAFFSGEPLPRHGVFRLPYSVFRLPEC
ncbi:MULTISPECIES: hypothetical protein [Kingella]|uniref:Uncharacterized protein n=1 Tax=Kingella bonacorsii TaxID=2796361 RepID=A0ABS1BQZ4_9NEIS|nr:MULTISPECIES: hypothetical protein [Kingella]MBK0395673.1 hypothetical protein [Kingella bonacorsii]